jgi:hypothetical protein
MIGEILVWGFFSALGWMGANWTVDQISPDKKEIQICSEWKEELQSNGTTIRTRTCEPKK